MALVTLYGGLRTCAQATVTVLDAGAGGPVANATVVGHWQQATRNKNSGATNTNGNITFNSDYLRLPASGTAFVFVIDNVTEAGWTWDKAHSVTSASITVP